MRKILLTISTTLMILGTLPLAFAEHGKTAGVNEEASDLWLKAKLVTIYTLNEHLNPFDIDVKIDNGVAKLGGIVETSVEKDLAEELAKSVDGIKSVKNDVVVDEDKAIQVRSTSTAKGSYSFSQRIADASTTAKIKSKLLWNRNTSGMAVNVETKNDKVVLSGAVQSDSERDLAGLVARNTSGVSEVRNNLTLATGERINDTARGSLATPRKEVSDSWINAKARTTLLFTAETWGSNVVMNTKDGVVTLSGAAKNPEQKLLITKLIKDVVGVKDVVNDLKIDPAS